MTANDKRRFVPWGPPMLAVLALALIAVTWGPPAPSQKPPGAITFGAFGDAPYYIWESAQFRVLLKDVNAHDLDVAIHVGDLFWRPCSDDKYRAHRATLDALEHPLVFTPGDNEWTDCHERGSGAYAPLERLEALRKIFFQDPSLSLGTPPLRLESQDQGTDFPAFVENARWTIQDVVFATVHVVGSRNGMEPFEGRSSADDDAAAKRLQAASAWIRETFAQASATAAPAVILAFHAAPGLNESPDEPYRAVYDPLILTLEEEAERFGRPVLLVHGDHHEYTVDQPLTRRTTGRVIQNLTRVQVPGSPDVGWVRVTVKPGQAAPFAFEKRVVPGWKYW